MNYTGTLGFKLFVKQVGDMIFASSISELGSTDIFNCSGTKTSNTDDVKQNGISLERDWRMRTVLSQQRSWLYLDCKEFKQTV